MAIANIEFYSDCLKRNVTFKALLPTDTDGKDNPHYSRPMKTLVLLHGYCGMCADWIWNSQIMDISNRYNLCVLLPSGENSFYLDGKETGRKYGTFVGEELLAFARKTFGISQKREDTFVGGFSMGGFGAIHLGLQFNHNFGKLFGFSAAMLVYGIKDMKPGTDNGVANYDYYKLMFGDLDKLEESENNPEVLVRKIRENQDDMPGIYLACGTEDFLIHSNQRFADFLTGQQVAYTFEKGPGYHNYDFWNRYLEPAVKCLLEIG